MQMKSLFMLVISFCALQAYGADNSFLDLFEKSTAIQNLSEVQITNEPFLIRNEIEKIMSKPLRISEVETILSLFDRIPSLNQQDVALIKGIFYYWPTLQKNYSSLYGRSSIRETNPLILLKNDEIKELNQASSESESGIFINGMKYTSLSGQKILNGKANWLFVSNKFEPIIFYGNLEGFLERLHAKAEFSDSCFSSLQFWKNTKYFSFEKDEQGNCSTASAQKFYTDLNRSFTENQRQADKSNWVLPASILAGVLIAYELRNKTVSIHLPSFKF